MERKRSDFLSDTYMVPLLDLNPKTLGPNFVRSYVSQNLGYILLEFRTSHQSFEKHPNFVVDFTDEAMHTFYVFSIPVRFEKTVECFVLGLYSQFSTEAKTKIKALSGLNYKAPLPNGKKLTARELLALDKDPDLRKLWEKELNVRVHPDAELIDPPSSANFMRFSLTLTTC